MPGLARPWIARGTEAADILAVAGQSPAVVAYNPKPARSQAVQSQAAVHIPA